MISRDQAKCALEEHAKTIHLGASIYLSTKLCGGPITDYFRRLVIGRTGTDYWLGFINLNPRANWSHACQYFTISSKSGSIQVKDYRDPPNGKYDLEWLTRTSG